MEDLVPYVIERMPPEELAFSLWANNDEVRAAFIENFTERYESGFSDDDRRDFLKKVREAVHSKALDRLVTLLAVGEYNFAKSYFTHDQISRVNRTLEAHEVKDWEGKPLRIRSESQDPMFKISGEAWHEARESWRNEVRKLFPSPE